MKFSPTQLQVLQKMAADNPRMRYLWGQHSSLVFLTNPFHRVRANTARALIAAGMLTKLEGTGDDSDPLDGYWELSEAGREILTQAKGKA